MVSLRSLTALPALVLLFGCASLGRPSFERPDVVLQQIAVVDVSTSGAVLELLLAIDNPNVFAVHGKSLAVTLDLDETPFGEATRAEAFQLAARDTTQITVPVSFTWSGVGAAARSILTTGQVAYSLELTVDLETPFGTGRVPYRQSGNIPVVGSVIGARSSHP